MPDSIQPADYLKGSVIDEPGNNQPIVSSPECYQPTMLFGWRGA
jgi:hypothetical protein